MQQLHTMHANRQKKRKAKLEEKRQVRQKTHSREDIRSAELAKKAQKKRFVTQGLEGKAFAPPPPPRVRRPWADGRRRLRAASFLRTKCLH